MKISKAFLLKAVYAPEDLPQMPYKEIAFVGRSNVGKSSLLNTLANNFKLAKVSSSPGKTRSVNFFLVNDAFLLVDLPGYGFARVSKKEMERWKNLVNAYLHGRDTLAGVFLLIDSRIGPTNADLEMKRWLEHYRVRYAVIAMKVDKLKGAGRATFLNRIASAMGGVKVIPFSARTREGRAEVLKEMDRMLKAR
jgi:GTP-binding protein